MAEDIRKQWEAEKNSGRTTSSFEDWSSAHVQAIKDKYREITGSTLSDEQAKSYAGESGNISDLESKFKGEKTTQEITGRTGNLQQMYQQELSSGTTTENFETWKSGHLKNVKTEYLRMSGQQLDDSQAQYWAEREGNIENLKTVFADQIARQIYTDELGRNVDPSGYKTYTSILAGGGTYGDVVGSIKNSEEWMYNVGIPSAYWDVLGREPDAEGLQHYKDLYKQGYFGDNTDIIKDNIKNDMRNSQEYIEKGGAEGEAARDLTNMIEFPEEYPEFVWDDERQAQALEYAEAQYGPYYATMLEELMSSTQLARTRTEEDYQTALQLAQNDLNDYLGKSEEERRRLNEDFEQAMFREIEDLGLDKEAIAEQKLRSAEDYGIATDDIIRRYAKYIPEVIESFANKGMTFSGKRVGEELYARETEQLELEGVERTYERRLADLERSERLRELEYQRTTGDITKGQQRGIYDIERGQEIAQRKMTEEEARLARLKQRSTEDITEEERLKKRQLEWEKQEQMATGFYSPWQQQTRAYETYLMNYPRLAEQPMKAWETQTGIQRPIQKELGYTGGVNYLQYT